MQAHPAVANVLSEERFAAILERWLPLIYRGAIEYAVPGKFDPEDLVAEGRKLLFEEVQHRVVRLEMWEVDSNDFEKYFKTAYFHRLVDLKRSCSTKKRDHKKEVHATDDFDPLESLAIAALDDPEKEILSQEDYERLMERLSVAHQRVLECVQHPPEALLKVAREHHCPQCLYRGEPTPSGICPLCLQAGFDEPAVLQTLKSPSRVLQSEIQEYLGMKRMAVSDAIYWIRQTYRTMKDDPDIICLKNFMAMFGYGEVEDEDGQKVRVAWPMAASCRYEEGTPTRSHLTYYSLKNILNPDEVTLLDFMVSRTNEYYATIKFTDLSRRLGISVHRVREAVDSIRVKLEFVDAGVPLKDIPRVI
jgi:hypothetical protein